MGSSSSSRSGLAASARASDARVSSPPEKPSSRTVELVAAEAEPANRRGGGVAPAIAAGVLELRLGLGVRAQRRLGRVAAGHPPLELRQLGLDLEDPCRGPTGRTREASSPPSGAGAGRGGRRERRRASRPSRRPGPPRRRAPAAAWSYRCRCGPTAPCARQGSSLNETPLNSVRAPMFLVRPAGRGRDPLAAALDDAGRHRAERYTERRPARPRLPSPGRRSRSRRPRRRSGC